MKLRPYPLPKFTWKMQDLDTRRPQPYPSSPYPDALIKLFSIDQITTPVDSPLFKETPASFFDDSLTLLDAHGVKRTFQKVDGSGKLYTPKLPFDFGYYRAALDIIQGVLRVGESNQHSQEIALQSDGNESEESYSLPSQQPTLYVPAFSSRGERMNIWQPIVSLQSQYGIPRAKVNRTVEDYLIRMLQEQPRLDGNDLTVHSGVRIGDHVWFWNPKTNQREHHSGKEWADKAWKYAFDPDYLEEGRITELTLQDAQHYLAWLTSDDPNWVQVEDNPDYSNLLRTFRGNLLMGTEQKNGSLWVGNSGNGKSLLINFLTDAFGDNAVKTIDTEALKSKGFDRANAVASLKNALYAINDDADAKLELADSVLKTLTTGGRLHSRTIGQDGEDFTSRAYVILASNHIPDDQLDNAVARRWCFVNFKRGKGDDFQPLIHFLQRYGILPFLWLSLQQAVDDPDSDLRPNTLSEWNLLTEEERQVIDAIMKSENHIYIIPKGVHLTRGIAKRLGLARVGSRQGSGHGYRPDINSNQFNHYAAIWKFQNGQEEDAED